MQGPLIGGATNERNQNDLESELNGPEGARHDRTQNKEY